MASTALTSYGGTQADYLERKECVIGRAVQMISENVSFDDILGFCAEGRTSIAHAHNTDNADSFGLRRDDESSTAIADMTTLDAQYEYFGNQALDRLCDLEFKVLDIEELASSKERDNRRVFAIYRVFIDEYPPGDRYRPFIGDDIRKMLDLETQFILWSSSMEIDGTCYPLSQYLSWMVSPLEGDPLEAVASHSKVTVIHQDKIHIKPMLAHISSLFQRAVSWTGEIEELMEIMGIFRFEFSHCMPFHRGSAAIAEWLETAVYRYHGFEDFSYDVQVDLEALTARNLDGFLEEYPDMINLY